MKKQKVRVYLSLSVLVLVTLILTGCGKSISQRAGEIAAEKAIEKQTGGKADVDVDGENVKIKTEQGNLEAGENVKLPSDFPNDIYVIDGKIKMAVSSQANEGQTVSIETDKSIEEAVSIYKEKLKSDGWKVTGDMNFSGYASIIAEKDNRTVTVMIGKGEGKTTVNIVVAKKQ